MISRTLLTLLLLSAAGANTGAVRDAERHHVVVVGAGVSGFSAAATLLENNVTDIVVLEASSRTGGRIKTVEFGGVPIDLGAEFCHGEVDNAVYELANPHGLLTSYDAVTQPEMHIYANTSGHIFNSTQINALAGKAFKIMYEDDIQHFNGSIGEYFYPRLEELLRSDNVEPALGEALRNHVPKMEGTYSAADNLGQLGAWGSTLYVENEGDLGLKWKTGGYKTIFDLISKKFVNPADEIPVRSKILLNKQVTRIEQRGAEVRVETADGSSYLADHVIVAVSLGVLKDRAEEIFHPSLPARKTAAIETIGFGCVAKVFMLFPERWWPIHKNIIVPFFSDQELKDYKETSAHGHWAVETTAFQPVLNNNRMLCAWFFGAAARHVESLTEEDLVAGLMELLDKLVGHTFKLTKPESVLRSGWCNDPLVKGTYSYLSLNSDRQNITCDDLGEPVLSADSKPLILFAGEATHPQYHGTVHGAIGAGRREANRIVNYPSQR